MHAISTNLLRRFSLANDVLTSVCLFSHRASASHLLSLLANMPKEPKAASELRHFRMKSKADKQPPPPSTVNLQVLGNGGEGNPRSLYVFTDGTRYLFNCSEGTQRLAHEHKMRLSKLEHVLFTYKNWDNIGGLPGLSLTIQEIGVPEITIHGPPGTEEIFELTQPFMATDYLKVNKRTYTDGSYMDNCMEITYVPIFGDVLKAQNFPDLAPTIRDDSAKSKSITHSPDPASKRQRLSDELKQDVAVAYICRLLKKPGELIISKCVEKGVPPGPLLGELKSGKDITLHDGTVIKSDDVVAPDDPGPIFIVVECPDKSFLPSLLEADPFKAHQSTAKSIDDIACTVVHFTSPDVMAEPKYIQWMEKFPASTFHLTIHSYNSPIGSIGTQRIQHQLHLVHPHIFPLLKTVPESVNKPIPGLEGSVIPTETLMKFHLRPKKGLCRESSIQLKPESFVQEALGEEGFEESLASLKENLVATDMHAKDHNSYPEIVFLGTGSMIPSKVRNVSAILVNVTENANMLLDCGEGTYSQLFHMYGPDANSKLMGLKCIFISHLHADHHLGLIQMMKQRGRAFQTAGLDYQPLVLLAPSHIYVWLKNYHYAFEPVLQYFKFLPSYAMKPTIAQTNNTSSSDFKPLTELTVENIVTVPVIHCNQAYGIVVKFSSGFKLVYSGDTVPCQALINEGNQCSILIHEATMEDDLVKEAEIKKHSTTSQAIEVGTKMKAGFTILTHFSQRYSKIPVFNENFHDRVGVAFDNMRIRPCDLSILPLLTPTLKCLFAKHYEEMKGRTEKKLMKEKLMKQAIGD